MAHLVARIAAGVLIAFLVPATAAAAGGGGGHGSLGAQLPLWSVLPFVGLLLCIAVLPLVAHHWWESNRNRGIVSGIFGGLFTLYLIAAHGGAGAVAILHAILYEYIPFIALLGALFVISGGIYIKGSLAGSPLSNTAILSIGTLLASFIGTTGASMVLIRPLLRANKKRKRKVHLVVFFIFTVSNCGGLLTPLGDPPLFLGFLKGVPFEWTFSLWQQWLLVNGILLILFNFVDEYILDKEEKERKGSQLEAVLEHKPLRIEGWHNIFFLGGIVLVILGKGNGWGTGGRPWPLGIQEGLMVLLAIAAYLTTKAKIRKSNEFTFAPIIEVAVLFAGIFVTMVAPLLILNTRGKELGLSEPWQYFWGTGLLSSFLDNAPTYLTFGATACGQLGVSAEGTRYMADFLAKGDTAVGLLAAISCGAVFMGANTYIGNGPNFMVKAIAEENGVKMPSFFGYMIWSGIILIPILVGVTLLFFR